MDAIEALKTRRSIRRYTKAPVAREAIEQIVDCARCAPTAMGKEPWEFVAITEPATLQRLAGLADYGKFIADSGCCIAVFCKDLKFYLEDGSAATQNILLAAHALGLGACWVAGDKKEYAGSVAQMLGVPEGYRLVSLIPMGYPDEHPTREKRPLPEMLHWERF
jgi:nitroreductase